MRVFISLCGEGLGHTSRMLALSRALRESGHRPTLAAYGRSLEVLHKSGERTMETFPEAHMTGNDGRFSLPRSILASSGTPLDILRAYQLERNAIERMNADAVVADSRLSTAMAGGFSGLPTFYVSNQTEFRFAGSRMQVRLPKLFSGAGRAKIERLLSSKLPRQTAQKLVDLPLSAPYGFADQILVPDFKPPDSVCLPLVSRDNDMRKKTFFPGPMNTLAFGAPKPNSWGDGRKPRVLVTFGGQRFREGMAEQAACIAHALPAFNFLIAGMSVKEDCDDGNVSLRRFLPDANPFAAAADYLVIPGGHSSIMESILLEKPAVVIPDEGQAEQESNARQYKKLGLGETITVGKLAQLGKALGSLAAHDRAHRSKLSVLAREGCEAQNGAKNAARMIESFVERIRY